MLFLNCVEDFLNVLQLICNANFILQHENCNRAFARSENRKIHMRSHTGDKPFNCKYAQEFNCTKKFSNSSDRAKHEQTHKDPVSSCNRIKIRFSVFRQNTLTNFSYPSSTREIAFFQQVWLYSQKIIFESSFLSIIFSEWYILHIHKASNYMFLRPCHTTISCSFMLLLL